MLTSALFRGHSASCSPLLLQVEPASMDLRLIFIGPPGAGKGTQAAYLLQDAAVCHLSSGDMLRAAVSEGTEVGKLAKPVMEAGQLVSDDILVALVKENIKSPACKNGWILDGFPRTITQAEKLDEMLAHDGKELHQALEFAIPDALLVRRISGRRIHAASGRTYHVDFHPPKSPGRDDVTNELLMQRADDNEAALTKRLDSFHKQTEPVIEYYRRRGVLTTLNADKPANEVYARIQESLRKIGKWNAKGKL